MESIATALSRKAVKFIPDHRDRPFFLCDPAANIQWPRPPNEHYRGKGRVGFYGDFVVEFDRMIAEVNRPSDELDSQ